MYHNTSTNHFHLPHHVSQHINITQYSRFSATACIRTHLHLKYSSSCVIQYYTFQTLFPCHLLGYFYIMFYQHPPRIHNYLNLVYFQVSGLSDWISSQIIALDHLNPAFLVLVLCSLLVFITEVTTNAAICALFLPILSNLVSFFCTISPTPR